MAEEVTEVSGPTDKGRPLLLWLVLVAVGLSWGMTQPLSKVAVSTGHHPVGVAFWATAGAALLLGLAQGLRGKALPLGRRSLIFFLVCGILGTAMPNVLSYSAYRHLPVGVMTLLLALVPMATFLIALPFKLERPELRRLCGLGLGAVAVLLLVLPKTSLPEPEKVAWIALPVLIALSYAAENIVIAVAKPPGCDALCVLCGLTWAALLLLTPTMLASGAWLEIWHLGPPELAILTIACLHVGAYFGFIVLIEKAGPVFAAQVGYVVTTTGVIAGILFFGERPSAWIWAALALIVIGLALVQPRRDRSA